LPFALVVYHAGSPMVHSLWTSVGDNCNRAVAGVSNHMGDFQRRVTEAAQDLRLSDT
jgi:hypothetical protein